MQKNILFCIFAFALLLLISLFYNKAYLELLRYTELIDRSDNVHNGFQNLSREVNNAAVITPDLVQAGKSPAVTGLFFTDSLSVVGCLNLLKATVKDSVNIQIAARLDTLVRSELVWLLNSNVPDSAIHNRAPAHLKALQNINVLITSGINRTSFLREHRMRQLNQASFNMRIWMILFIALSGFFLTYLIIQLFRQLSKRKIKEKELEISEANLVKSERRFRTLVENSDDIIAMLDEHMQPIYRTSSAERLTGYTAADRENSVQMEHVHPDDLETIKDCLAEMKVNPGKAIPVTYRIMHKHGHYIWLEGTFTNRTDDPNIKAIVANMRDITARKESEESLKKTVKEISDYKYALDESSIVAITDQKGIIKHVNDNFCNISKYSREELLGQDHRIINSGYHTKEFIRNLWITIANGQIWRGELRNKAKDGTIYWVDTTIVPFLDTKGKPYQYIAIRADITQQKEIREMLSRNEATLREAQTIAHISNWEIDLQTNVHMWSDEFYNIFGIKKNEVVPSSEAFLSFIHPDDSKHVREKINNAFENYQPSSFNARINIPDGSIRYIYSEWRFDFDMNQKPVRLFGILQDVTEKRIIEDAILNTLEEKNIILESIGDAFFAVDKDWNVTYWNRIAETALGTEKHEIIGKNLWEVFSNSIESLSYKKYHEAIETNEVVHFEDYYGPMNKWYEISAYPSKSGLSVYFKDITERKVSEMRLSELNSDLQKRAKELQLSNQELEQFAYVASHDLQEPLRMVTGFLTQLEKKYGNIIDDKGKQYIGFAVDGAKRMRQIILDLLEFSRVGRMEGSIERIDLNELVDEIKLLFRKTIEEKRALVEADHLPSIQAVRTPMQQVFQNLISNALKYSRKDVKPHVKITVEESDDHWKFAVTDNGIGIEAEYFDRIFIIFQRLHNKDEFSGTGMGLAISNKIIDNMGGKIWVASEEGKGSVFYFTIPKK